MTKKRVSPHLILALIILFHFINNIVILYSSRAYPYEHVGKYTLNSRLIYLRIREALTGEDLVPEGKVFFSSEYPLLLNTYTALFCLVFGFSYNIAVLSNTIFMIILVYSVYGIGKILHSERAGLLAAFIISFFPGVFAPSRVYLQTFPITAITALCVYTLLNTHFFSKGRESLAFGICLAVLIGLKQTFFLFLLGLFSIYVAIGIYGDLRYRQAKRLRLRLKNIVLSILIGVSFGMIGYIPLLDGIVNHTLSNIDRPVKGAVLALDQFTFYARMLAGTLVLPFFFMLYVLSIPYLFIKNKVSTSLLIFWVGVRYFFYSLMVGSNISPRFIIPALPAIALSIAISIASLRKRSLRLAVVLLAVLVSLSQFFLISYLPGRYDVLNAVNSIVPHRLRDKVMTNPNIYFNERPYGMFPGLIPEIGLLHAVKYDWGIGQITSAISPYLPRRLQVRVEVLHHLLAMPLQYYCEIHDLPVYLTQAETQIPVFSPSAKLPDFFVVSSIHQRNLVLDENAENKIRRELERFYSRDDFVLISNFTLPDTSTVQVYRRLP